MVPQKDGQKNICCLGTDRHARTCKWRIKQRGKDCRGYCFIDTAHFRMRSTNKNRCNFPHLDKVTPKCPYSHRKQVICQKGGIWSTCLTFCLWIINSKLEGNPGGNEQQIQISALYQQWLLIVLEMLPVSGQPCHHLVLSFLFAVPDHTRIIHTGMSMCI